MLEAAGVPNGPINTIEQVFAEPQAIARGAAYRTAASRGRQGLAGRAARCGSRPRRSSTSGRRRSLGEHTDEILRGLLGLKDDEVAKLRADGAV